MHSEKTKTIKALQQDKALLQQENFELRKIIYYISTSKLWPILIFAWKLRDLFSQDKGNRRKTLFQKHFPPLAAKTIKKNQPTPYPKMLTLETTNNCNLTCFMCSCQYATTGNKKRQLSLKLLQKIAKDVFPKIHILHLTVTGEPLLSKNFFEEVALAKKYKLKLCMTTNGLLLNTPQILETVVSSFSHINISIDAATAKTYAKIRGNHFALLIQNIQNLVALKKQRQSNLSLALTYVLMQNNIQELPEIIELAHQLGLPSVICTHLTPSREALFKNMLSYQDEENLEKIFTQTRDKARQYQINLDLPPALLMQKKSDYSHINTLPSCKLPWDSVLINANGDVVLCCAYSLTMGNVKYSSFHKIWNNPKYQEIRTGLLNGTPIPQCRHCAQLNSTTNI